MERTRGHTDTPRTSRDGTAGCGPGGAEPPDGQGPMGYGPRMRNDPDDPEPHIIRSEN
ncbi:hypothetical protein [Streptomyces boncukensis]|uniref:Uncharacterized protein n=1 Tax=Streptomyces boncukensis TaxID=2711219 RepID=A0A6G4WY92_9ACTN|nr:hypothetical protein [Streptomyces boncukensis]NGO70205.1 hypothetical protein [Streptomyces boncukensis]